MKSYLESAPHLLKNIKAYTTYYEEKLDQASSRDTHIYTRYAL